MTNSVGPIYVVQAFDANHRWLDTDSRNDGYATEVAGPRALLEFMNSTTHGMLRDLDAETSTHRLIAYWIISVTGIVREIYTTAYGRSCRRCMATIPKHGPGCQAPQPVPVFPAPQAQAPPRCWSSDCGRPVTGVTPASYISLGGSPADLRPTCTGCHRFHTGETRTTT